MNFDFSKTYPLLPLRDAVVFPHTTRRILVGRDMSLRALEFAESHNNEIILVAQKDVTLEEIQNPMLDLYSVGVIANVSSVMPFPNGCVKVVLEGLQVVDLRSVILRDGFLNVTVSPRKTPIKENAKTDSFDEVLTRFREYATKRNIAEGMVDAFFGMESQLNAYYGIVPFLQVSLAEKQSFLEVKSLDEMSAKLLALMDVTDDNENVLVRIQQSVRQKMAQQQKEWFISEQIRQLQDELDGDGDGASEPEQLLKKIKAKNFSPTIVEKLEDEIARMKLMQPTSPEYAVSRNYIDWFLAMPYGVYTDTVLNMKKVKSELDSKHFGLDKVKERIMDPDSLSRRASRCGQDDPRGIDRERDAEELCAHYAWRRA